MRNHSRPRSRNIARAPDDGPHIPSNTLLEALEAFVLPYVAEAGCSMAGAFIRYDDDDRTKLSLVPFAFGIGDGSSKAVSFCFQMMADEMGIRMEEGDEGEARIVQPSNKH